MKKPILFISLLLLLSFLIFKNIQDSKPKFEDKVAIKEKQRKQLKKDAPKEYEKYHKEIRKGSNNAHYKSNYILNEFDKAKKKTGFSRGAPLPWEHIGPGNVGGRTRSILIDQKDTTLSTFFAGSVGGGIWKTQDAGESWNNLTASYPNLSISSLVQSNDDKNIIYASTGNGFVSRGAEGNGIWKSNNEGQTWEVLPNTQNDQFTNITRLAIGQDDKKLLMASTIGRREFGFSDNDSRIMISKNGGEDWEEKYFSESRIQQIVVGKNDVAYATIIGLGIFRSLDIGETWDNVFEPENFDHGRIEIAELNDTLFASVDVFRGADKVFMSTDKGEQWLEVINADGSDDLGSWMGGQAWFDNCLSIVSNDATKVYLGGQSSIIKLSMINETRSDSTIAANLEVIADGYRNYQSEIGSKGVHVDHHALIVLGDPNGGPDFILNGNDGGISYSRDGGETFRQTGDTFAGAGLETLKGYNVSQFYGVDKMNGQDRYIGGTQDNGTWISDMDPDEASIWRSAPSGDGFEAAWNYENPNLILESSQFNNIYKSFDGGQSWIAIDIPRGSFITRIEASQLSPDLVFIPFSDDNAGEITSGLLRSNDFGSSFTPIAMPSDWNYNGSTGPPVEISLSSPRVVWSGNRMEEGNNICVSINSGLNFRTTSLYQDADLGTITGIASHPFNYKKAYVLFSAPDAPKVIATSDLGETWEDLSGYNGNVDESSNGFPDVATYSLLVMPFDTNTIWVGTEIGIFESTDGGLNWQYADNGLPPAPIWQMKIVNDEVVVATHARGIWKVSLPELENYTPVASLGIPRLKTNNVFGSTITGSYELPTPFESSRLSFIDPSNDQVLKEINIDENDSPITAFFTEDFNIALNNDTIMDIIVLLESNVDTFTFIDRKIIQIFNIYEVPADNYSNDFENGQRDLARIGFNYNQEPDFNDVTLNSIHPYAVNTNYIGILQQGLNINSESTFSFDEVVIVETGNGDPTTAGFYDYVTIEGTNNRGATWVELDKYDSSFDPVWEDAYNNNMNGTQEMTIKRSIDLNNFFVQGDTIFIRFRLFADGGIEAWGWSIDNINYTSNGLSIRNSNLDLSKLDVYPNPVQNITTINFEIPEPSKVIFTLFGIDGKAIRVLKTDIWNKGVHKFEFKKGPLSNGTYILQMESEFGVKTKKLIIQGN